MRSSCLVRRLRTASIALLASVAVSLSAATEADRLSALGRVWAAASFLDPDVVFGSIDWDAALIRAIPKARAANTGEELADAVGAMLAELRDPATKVFVVS